MKKNKEIKKNIIFFGIIIIFVSIAFLIAYFMPNKIGFKIFNNIGVAENLNGNTTKALGLFNKSENKYNNWQLISKINKFGILYNEKKYKELNDKIKQVEEENCNIEKKEILEFCENLFYLDGLAQYKLGEEKKDEERHDLFSKSIDKFRKTLLINNENVWAKENIEFILNKQKEEKRKEDKKNNKEDGGEKNKDKSGDGKEGDDGKKTGNNHEKNSGDRESSSEKEKKAENSETEKDKEGNKSDDEKNNNEQKKSRLPENIRKEIERRQRELERGQENQQGFSRSKMKRDDEQDSFNPFSNDPFFKDFFGDAHSGKLKKEISNENEKDW